MRLELQILENSKDSKLQVRGEESFESREWCIKKKIPTNFCPCSLIFQRGAMGSTKGWHCSLWLLIHQATKFVFTSTFPFSQICFSVLHPHPTSERPVGQLWLIPAGSVQRHYDLPMFLWTTQWRSSATERGSAAHHKTPRQWPREPLGSLSKCEAPA